MKSILLYCRPGFERECAQEITDIAADASIDGEASAETDSGFVVYAASNAEKLNARIHFKTLIFARQWIHQVSLIQDLPSRDRLTPLLAFCRSLGKFSSVCVEHADTNAAKTLSSFCRKFSVLFASSASEEGLLRDDSKTTLPRLHLFFIDTNRCYLGYSWPNNSSSWPMGIPRLRFPAAAPSRSTLKLAEAFMHFFSPEEQEKNLRAGMRAIDLGAAPGGWSWQFAQRGIHVTAIDNGSLAKPLLATGMVEHIKADGFRYRPRHPVEWMVCDMVEKPHRIAQLVTEWIARGDCRQTIFNLKLPMKKRYQAVDEAKQLILSSLEKSGISTELRLKHLYHDREEVTGYLKRLLSNRKKR